MKTVIHDTLLRLSTAPEESHVQIQQELYNTLKLPFEKQLTLYTHVLGPVSSGQLSSSNSLTRAVGDAERIILNNK
ncbi:PAS factor family protein [Vibrio campbellii]|uniref:PAS factor family protein n=1 Tax=Vibrio campbellii TaxID=680 RepID=UPI001F1DB064|nr:PAS factor family protein [Vibrio campbellii]MCE7728896.1 secretion factor PAS [Vibrio campbellii]